MAAWMAADLSQLDLVAIQIDGLHVGDDLVLVAALGIDADGGRDRERRRGAGADRQSSAGSPAGTPRTCLDQCDAHPTAEWIAQQITEAFPWPAYTTETCAKSSERRQRCEPCKGYGRRGTA
jgi:hypothetical protein